VNNEPRRQTITPGEFGLADGASLQQAAFLQEFGTGRAMYRAIDSTAAEQGRVRRVDDRVNVQGRNVSLPGANESPR
jgi:hypothetical protein